MPLILGATAAAAGAQDNSCRFNSGDDPVMEKSLGTPTSTKIFTVSTWVKAMSDASADTCVAAGYVSSSDFWNLQFGSSKIQLTGTGNLDLATTQVFRDASAWWHICMAVDTSQVTDTNRVKLYVNGTQITSFSTTTYPTQDDVPAWCNSSATLYVGNGRTSGALSKPFEGYMAEFCFVDGQQLAPTSFGEFDSDSPTIWKPIDVSGLTFGDNGCYLDFEDSANLGNDANGGTDLTETNITAVDQTTDTPVNNFATWNPLARNPSDTGSLAEGNTVYTISSNAYNTKSTLAMTAGKWYWEQKATLINARVGVNTSQANNNKDSDDGTFYWGSTGFGGTHTVTATDSTNWQLTNNDTSSNISTLPGTAISYSAGDIVMVALDVDTGKMWYGLNGTWFNSGDPRAGTTPVVTITNGSPDPFMVNGSSGSGSSSTISVNFGNPAYAITSSNADGNGYGNFEYAVPTGFYALCTKNLAEFG